MSLNFETAEKLFKQDRINDLSTTAEGMRFLKVRSFSRSEYLEAFAKDIKLDLPDKKKLYFKTIYESSATIKQIDDFIKRVFSAERSVRSAEEDSLIAELYKIDSFGWSGSDQGGLEKPIVDNFVKKIRTYDGLKNAIENQIFLNLQTYVYSSWYNHWTSIVIEDLLKEHDRVLPAIGLIKKIDFFVDNVPFDLKVTYLPEGYISDYRSEHGLGNETTKIRALSRNLGLKVKDSSNVDLKGPALWQQLEDHPSAEAKNLLKDLRGIRQDILVQVTKSPEILAKWLYENQGERRFDSSNRLFVVLVDSGRYFDSWKLKRAKPLIKESVNNYLNKKNVPAGFELDFNWESEVYSVRTDVIFVVK
jgi:hypothetical protein